MLLRKRFYLTALIATGLATFVAPAWGWGVKGHQIVALIAERRLAASNPDVLKKVHDLLGVDMHVIAACPDTIRIYVRSLGGSKPVSQTSLITACGAGIDPATVATRFPNSGDWHYINLNVPLTGSAPAPTDAVIASTCATQNGCAPQKIVDFSKLVANAPAALQQRDAIVFLVHLVGDLHQPLHSAVRNNDLGGNSVPVTYGPASSHSDNLHHVWDDDIINNIKSGDQTNLSADTLAQLLFPSGSAPVRANVSQVNDWARESYGKAVTVAYAGVPDGRDVHDPFAIDVTTYQPPAEDAVTAQLVSAGERLASLLVTALGTPGSTSAPTGVGSSVRPILAIPHAGEFMPPGVTKNSDCKPVGHLPDKGCTPGAVSGISLDEICGTSTTGRRDVSEKTKTQVFNSYGIMVKPAKGLFEVDHFIPLELGGSNDVANLWPQPADPIPGFHQKDKVENFLHTQVCKNGMKLDDAQRAIATDWLKVAKDNNIQ